MLTKMNKFIDVIIPRGGKNLVKKVQSLSSIPTIGHLEGVCHSYVDKDANPKIAIKVIHNAKLRNTSICGPRHISGPRALWHCWQSTAGGVMMRFFAVAVAAEAVTFAPASTTQRYAALDAAFWRDVDAQVGPDPPPRFAQFCRQFRDTWNDDVAEMGPESTELDDDKARPLLVNDQYVARHGGLFPGLRTTPWWDPADFAWLDPLVKAAPDISSLPVAANSASASGSTTCIRIQACPTEAPICVSGESPNCWPKCKIGKLPASNSNTVVTPSSKPVSASSRISPISAVSTKNFIICLRFPPSIASV